MKNTPTVKEKRVNGMPLVEWIPKRLDEEGITTARVFLVVGFILGILFGACGTLLTLIIAAII